ncbi:MAG: phosphoglycerate dehydrogenase [Anaerolineaceae bacterium]|nr:phosphoglycerate dehydrogenase [Anaerolineaceae bacterium]
MLTVMLSAPYMNSLMSRFQPVFDHYNIKVILPQVFERMEEEDLLPYAGQVDGVICGDDRFSARVLNCFAPRLKVLSKWGTGVDSIDRLAAAELGIQVRNTSNAFTLPVADTVMGYMLAFARRLHWMDAAMKAGVWKKIPGRSLSECTLGVIGVGNIGKAVIRRARSFGMKLVANDIIPIAPDFILENGVELTSLRDLMGWADFISVNCDLNPTSLHIINSESLSWCQPQAVLINSARGPLVDELALIAALQSGRIAGAALDVFEVEPLPLDSPLRKMENVMLASHNANSSPSAWERVHWNTLRNLVDGLGLDPGDITRFSE